VKETETIMEQYRDKNNTKSVYWDLPGCGRSNFLRDTYLKTVDFNKFDFLIIMTATRLTENDHWLVIQAKKLRNLFFCRKIKSMLTLKVND
jgi:hypothetical protein